MYSLPARLPAVILALLALLWCALAAGVPPPGIGLQAGAAAAGPYQLAASFDMTQGFVKQADWLDSDRFLTLLLSPDGAAVWCTSYSQLGRDKFISSAFIEKYICNADLASRLEWKLSPAKRYLFFSWFGDDGARQWTLLDISAAPSFKVRKFAPPAGMQIANVLFSPDDRYAVFVHDSFKDGSDVSLLVMDLASGVEYWRTSTAQVSFVSDLWWGGAIYDTPRFSLMASLLNGEALAAPALINCNLTAQTLVLAPEAKGLLFGADALWGHVGCFSTGEGREGPFYIAATIPGQRQGLQVSLTAHPVSLLLLPEPGLVLINNTADYVTNQLWLVNVLSGDKFPLDSDCAGFSLASDGKLLVRSRTTNELRVYERKE